MKLPAAPVSVAVTVRAGVGVVWVPLLSIPWAASFLFQQSLDEVAVGPVVGPGGGVGTVRVEV